MSASGHGPILAALLMALPNALIADQGLRRVIPEGEAPRWAAVASLRVVGKAVCTAVLISEQEAITAAHCVIDRASGKRTEPRYFTLVFGQGASTYAAVRKVTRVAILPEFLSAEPVTDLAFLSSDLALLALDRPVTAAEALPLQVADWPKPIGEFVDIVGYERDGPKAATLREGCMALESYGDVTAAACDVIAGISGAPVFLSALPDTPLTLVATVSSRSQNTALVVAIAPRLAELRGIMAGQGGE